jgi:hypothetical protein
MRVGLTAVPHFWKRGRGVREWAAFLRIIPVQPIAIPVDCLAVRGLSPVGRLRALFAESPVKWNDRAVRILGDLALVENCVGIFL